MNQLCLLKVPDPSFLDFSNFIYKECMSPLRNHLADDDINIDRYRDRDGNRNRYIEM